METTAAISASAGYAESAYGVKVVATVVKIDRLKVGDSVRAEFVSAAAVELVTE